MTNTTTELPGVARLIPRIANYTWGPTGEIAKNSVVFRLGRLGPESLSEHLAEAWLGIHPSGPAGVEIDSAWYGLDRFFGDEEMPFLVKGLHANEPLSIQCHPRALDARRLYERTMGALNAYPDPHQKDEAAYAVTRVEMLYGFRQPQAETRSYLGHVPTLLRLFAELGLSHSSIRDVVSGLLNVDRKSPSLLFDRASALRKSLEAKSQRENWEEWFLRLAEKHIDPANRRCDVGLFFLPIMNLVTLEPGEAIDTPAGTVHAYLRGQLLEVMRNSDCVIRCGLTTKFRDDEEMLRSAHLAAETRVSWVSQGVFTRPGRKRFIFGNGELLAFDSYTGPMSAQTPISNGPMIAVSLNAVGSFSEHEHTIEPYGSYLLSASAKPTTVELSSGELLVFYRPIV